MVHHLAFLWPWGDSNSNRWTTLLGGWPQTLEGIGALAAAYALLRKHNCHVSGCWRIGRHPVEGTNFITCHRHHPRQAAPTHHEILDAHEHRMSHVHELEERMHFRDDQPEPQ